MEKKMISVVMPVYNASHFIGKAVESVLSQTYQNIELIMVDDCSKDNSLEIARSYQERDHRIRILEQKKNQGVAKARNRGILEAQGDYIALIDSDDIWVSTKLEKQLRLLEEKNAQIAYCSYDFIDENDKEILKPFIVPESTNYKKMLISSVISCSTALIEAKLLKQNLFDSRYYHEDYVLWMKLLKIPAYAVGDKHVLAHYRQTTGSRSNNKVNAAFERWKTYRVALNLNLFTSVRAFCGYAIMGLYKYWGLNKSNE